MKNRTRGLGLASVVTACVAVLAASGFHAPAPALLALSSHQGPITEPLRGRGECTGYLTCDAPGGSVFCAGSGSSCTGSCTGVICEVVTSVTRCAGDVGNCIPIIHPPKDCGSAMGGTCTWDAVDELCICEGLVPGTVACPDIVKDCP